MFTVSEEILDKMFPNKRKYVCSNCGSRVSRKVKETTYEYWSKKTQKWEKDHSTGKEIKYFCTNSYPTDGCGPTIIEVVEIN